MFTLLDILSAISVDCPSILNIGVNLNLEQVNLGTWDQLQSGGDCCVANGIVCSSQRVTQINWNGFRLTGSISGVTTWPSTLQRLDLSLNSIVGSIPANLPNGLVYLLLDGNDMSGDLPILPNSLKYVFFATTGSLGNHFSGTLSLSQPIQVFAVGNWITNIIIQDPSQLTANCDISNTPLLGNSNLGSLSFCSQSNFYLANLLPITKTTTKPAVMTTTTKMSKTTTAMTTKSTVKDSSTTLLPTTTQALTTTSLVTTTRVQTTKLSSKTTIVSTTQFEIGITSALTRSTQWNTKFAFTTSMIVMDSSTLELPSESQISSILSDEQITATTKVIKTGKSRTQTIAGDLDTPQQLLSQSTDAMMIIMIAKLMIDSLVLGYIVMKMPLKRTFQAKKRNSVANNDFDSANIH